MSSSTVALKAFDPDIVKVILDASEAEGIKVVVNESPTGVKAVEGGLQISSSSVTDYQADVIRRGRTKFIY